MHVKLKLQHSIPIGTLDVSIKCKCRINLNVDF